MSLYKWLANLCSRVKSGVLQNLSPYNKRRYLPNYRVLLWIRSLALFTWKLTAPSKEFSKIIFPIEYHTAGEISVYDEVVFAATPPYSQVSSTKKVQYLHFLKNFINVILLSLGHKKYWNFVSIKILFKVHIS